MMEESNQDREFDTANLYREETYTDLRMGSIRKLVPVTAEGDLDSGRPVLFQGQAAMMTPAGQLPLNFELPVDSLAEAAAAFGAAVEEEARRLMEELQDLKRKQELASPLIQPAGGKIQL